MHGIADGTTRELYLEGMLGIVGFVMTSRVDQEAFQGSSTGQLLRAFAQIGDLSIKSNGQRVIQCASLSKVA